MAKVPYMLVVGDKEVEEGTVNVRKHGGDELGSVPLKNSSMRLKSKSKNALTLKGLVISDDSNNR